MSTKDELVSFAIVDGGTRGELLAQLSDIGRITQNSRPGFRLIIDMPGAAGFPQVKIPLPKILVFGLTNIEVSGLDRDDWDVSGWMYVTDRSYERFVRMFTPKPSGYEFFAEYNSKTRKGCIYFGGRP